MSCWDCIFNSWILEKQEDLGISVMLVRVGNKQEEDH